jgi:hypothetical protein
LAAAMSIDDEQMNGVGADVEHSQPHGQNPNRRQRD